MLEPAEILSQLQKISTESNIRNIAFTKSLLIGNQIGIKYFFSIFSIFTNIYKPHTIILILIHHF